MRPIGRKRTQELLDEGAQIIEVLEPTQYGMAHLPGALSIPAWELTRDRAETLRRDAPVVVYCFDNLWDLSSRAACLLELYGFTDVYEYVDGKVEWMAYGLPVEGDRGPFVGSALIEVPTCLPSEAPADVVARLEDGTEQVVVVTDAGIVVGTASAKALRAAAEGSTVLDVLEPSPPTIRPHIELSELDDEAKAALVTTPDGRLLGAVDPDAITDDSHPSADEFEEELHEALLAVQEHFGDREPEEEELRAFLRDRLIEQGRTSEEADRVLADMERNAPT